MRQKGTGVALVGSARIRRSVAVPHMRPRGLFRVSVKERFLRQRGWRVFRLSGWSCGHRPLSSWTATLKFPLCLCLRAGPGPRSGSPAHPGSALLGVHAAAQPLPQNAARRITIVQPEDDGVVKHGPVREFIPRHVVTVHRQKVLIVKFGR